MDIHLREKGYVNGSERFNILPDAPPGRRLCTVQMIGLGAGSHPVAPSKQPVNLGHASQRRLAWQRGTFDQSNEDKTSFKT